MNLFRHLALRMFGTKNSRILNALTPLVAAVNGLETDLQAATDAALRDRAARLREQIASGDPPGLGPALSEAFALTREVARRVLGLRHYDVQMTGGMVLHQGQVAEMATGEGKTLVATLPAVLNGLAGRGVHVVTVNDYLARRDVQWMGPVYHALGLSVAVLQSDQTFLFDPTLKKPAGPRLANLRPCSRQEAYRADITYGTNSEFGFDYLRDHMQLEPHGLVQRPLAYAIVDEVDNILIDEARTPLIISGPSGQTDETTVRMNALVPRLTMAARIMEGKLYEVEEGARGDYVVNEKMKSVALTEEGVETVERLLKVPNLYGPDHSMLVHFIEEALKAHTLYRRDRDYVVQDNEVVIVDEFTGRLMPGRRWGGGLHEAVEVKEGLALKQETQTLATVTLQNYFKLYGKLAGMTGTADTEAEEFARIYNLDVVVIPPHRPCQREDRADQIFQTTSAKHAAILAAVTAAHAAGRPVLIGTTSIEKSEALSASLTRVRIPHQVLNAKPAQAEREAEIVAQAGRVGAVTIATNMAGRGTDILLGGTPSFLAAQLVQRGNLKRAAVTPEALIQAETDVAAMVRYGLLHPENPATYALALAIAREQTASERAQVLAAGGLLIVGTERHESRRIDNQLRGRAGRQGDPGGSCFILSFEDEMFRKSGPDPAKALLAKLHLPADQPIDHPLVARALTGAQKRLEGRHFEARKRLLEYDNVLNLQRQTIYRERTRLLTTPAEAIGTTIRELRDQVVEVLFARIDPEAPPIIWPLGDLAADLAYVLGIAAPWPAGEVPDSAALLEDQVKQAIGHAEAAIAAATDTVTFARIRRALLLRVLDSLWKEHLQSMEILKEGIGLRGYAQKDPLREYQREGKDLFDGMESAFARTAIRMLWHLRIQSAPATAPAPIRP